MEGEDNLCKSRHTYWRRISLNPCTSGDECTTQMVPPAPLPLPSPNDLPESECSRLRQNYAGMQGHGTWMGNSSICVGGDCLQQRIRGPRSSTKLLAGTLTIHTFTKSGIIIIITKTEQRIRSIIIIKHTRQLYPSLLLDGWDTSIYNFSDQEGKVDHICYC